LPAAVASGWFAAGRRGAGYIDQQWWAPSSSGVTAAYAGSVAFTATVAG